jgi:membrane protein YdbS with pleckstrin-like domain
MALIPCPECKREVSDRAATCPHCGVRIAGGPAAAGGSAGTPPSPPPLAPFGPSGAHDETVVWEGAPSSRLMARELPGMLWAVAAPIFAILLLPDAMKMVGGLHKEMKTVIVEQGGTVRALVIGGIVVVSVLRLGRAALRFARLRATRYRITNQRLTIDSGLVAKRVDDVDLRSIDDVGLEQSPLERMLGVGRLSIVSTDRARPRLELYGIEAPRDVRERLRAGVYQASQRQIFTRST